MNESLTRVIKLYDKLIDECIAVLETLYVTIEKSDTDDVETHSNCQTMIDELEKRLEKFLKLRGMAEEQYNIFDDDSWCC